MMKLLKPLAFAGLGLSISTSSFAELEEIIVTATKREASVQDVPIAVTALSADAISKAGIKDVRDLSSLSASFSSSTSSSETAGTTLRVRGVGTSGNNIGLESAVGVFLDGIYLSRPGIALGDLVDVERIEILRGPQGTLFGRNTSAGAVNIITEKPSLNESAYWANLSAGNFDSRSVQIGGTFPLIEDELGFRFSAAKRDQDGFGKSVTSGEETVTRDRYSLKGQLLWAINDDMELRVIADYADADEKCCDAAVISESAVVQAGVYAFAGLPANAGVLSSGQKAFENRDTNGSMNKNGSEQYGLSAQLDWSLGWAELVGIVSYRDFDSFANLDNDLVALEVFDTFDPKNKVEFETWTAELRLQGYTDRLDWMVGVYYSDESIDALAHLRLGKDFSAYQSGGLWFPAVIPELQANFSVDQLDAIVVDQTGTSLLDVISSNNPAEAFAGVPSEGAFSTNSFTQEAQSFSIFTHNTYAVTEQLDLVFGLRWIDDKKQGQFTQLDNQNQACLNTLGKVAGGLLPSSFAPAVVGITCFSSAAPADLPGTPFPRSFDDSFEDQELTYTVKAVYQIDDVSNVYASFTHGYKAGGFNLDATAAIGGADPRFDSETTDAIEIGYKADLWDRRLRANFAAFHQELEDFQTLEFNGIRFETFNVPTVFSSGVEAEFLLSANDDLDISLALTFVDARYPDNCDGGKSISEAVSRLCGNDLANAPDFVAVLGANYSTALPGADLWFFANGSVRHENKRRTSNQANDVNGIANVRDFQNTNTKTTLRVGLSNGNGDWSVELWGNNIFDKQTRNVTFDLPLRNGARGVFFDSPRTYGLTLRTEL